MQSTRYRKLTLALRAGAVGCGPGPAFCPSRGPHRRLFLLPLFTVTLLSARAFYRPAFRRRVRKASELRGVCEDGRFAEPSLPASFFTSSLLYLVLILRPGLYLHSRRTF